MKTRLLFASVLAGLGLLAHAESMPIDKWLERVESMAPSKICGKDSIFLSCFAGTPDQCRQIATSTTRACAFRLRPSFPATIDSPEQAMRLGNQIGECAGRSYITERKKDLAESTPACVAAKAELKRQMSQAR